jgi:hypothetical protein
MAAKTRFFSFLGAISDFAAILHDRSKIQDAKNVLWVNTQHFA